MTKNILKKVLSAVVCISVIAGVATVSNALTVYNNSSESVLTDYIYYSGVRTFEYEVTYIYYSGLAVGAYLPDLYLKANSTTVCSVDTPSKTGPYWASGSTTYDYRLYNYTGKDVSITFNLKRH